MREIELPLIERDFCPTQKTASKIGKALQSSAFRVGGRKMIVPGGSVNGCQHKARAGGETGVDPCQVRVALTPAGTAL